MSAERPSLTAGGPLGGLGLGLWVIGLTIGFVVAVEHDPEAAAFRDTATRQGGVVVEVDGVELTVESDAGVSLVETDPSGAARIEVGDRVSLLVGDRVRLEEDVPYTPRRTSDFAAPLVLLLLGAALVTADPAILYPSSATAS